MGKVLGIDYGRRHIGLALSDETFLIAAPLKAIEINRPGRAIDLIKKVIINEGVSMIVLGIPLGIDGKNTEMSQEVSLFGTKLSKTTGVNLIYWEETATSKIASQRQKNKNKWHSEAARMILQEYLDNRQRGE